ncbi:hypothetical protein SAMN05446935_6145 [Burkholderia sp. YR290]|nr:hypothetical protein SAMN05446935_6145 [Burkholderia sp. YR290]
MSRRLKYMPLPGSKISNATVIAFLALMASVIVLDTVAVISAYVQAVR